MALWIVLFIIRPPFSLPMAYACDTARARDLGHGRGTYCYPFFEIARRGQVTDAVGAVATLFRRLKRSTNDRSHLMRETD